VKNTDLIDFDIEDIVESTTFDFSIEANGNLPIGFASFSGYVTGGAFSVYPEWSKEIVGDTSLEYTYISGLCAELDNEGTPTLAKSTSSRSYEAAQSFLANDAGGQGLFYGYPETKMNWYMWSFYAKRTSGTRSSIRGYFYNSNSLDNRSDIIDDVDYTQHTIYGNSMSSAIYCYPVIDGTDSSTGNDTIIIDDISLRKLGLTSMIGGTKLNSTSYTIETEVNWSGYGKIAGIFVEMDDLKNPQNYIIAEVYRTGDIDVNVMLIKCVDGVGSLLGSTEGELRADTFVLSVIRDGTTIQINYLDTPVIPPVTITDAAFDGDNYVGIFSTSSDITFNSINLIL
jgi:hypothetical protein